jgi:two-component system response regulator FixJ
MPDSGLVHIVDDDAEFRRSLQALLEAFGYKTRSYGSGNAIVAAMPRLTAGCILLDIQMPGTNGLDAQATLNERGCRLPVVMMTGHGDVPSAVRAMKAGAADFIEKPFDDETLIAVIGTALTRTASRSQSAVLAPDPPMLIALLSARERQVLRGILAGRSNKVIAFDLGLSIRTVEVHRARMLERLRVRNTAGAVRLAVLAGLTPSGC